MNRDAKVILGLVAGVGALVLGSMALRPGTTEVEYLPPVTLADPQDLGPSWDSAAVVVGTDHSGGSSILGMHFGRTTYRLSVQFYAPPGCSEVIDYGDRWPASLPQCASDVPVAGEVSGLGIAATGESIVAVDVAVERECYDQVARGDPWPPTGTACTLPQS